MDMGNNLFDNLIRFLARHSFPDATYGGPVSSLAHQALCLDSILVFLTQVAERSKTHNFDLDDNLPTGSFLLSNRTKKKVLIEGTMIFNESPKKGIPFLQGMLFRIRCKEHGFLHTPADSANIADFLVQNAFVDKKLLGLYLAKPDNQEILREFVNRLGFKGVLFSEVTCIETY
jgi:brefeldin A-resistance guanine nucleotide exchange factor 1